MDCTSSREKLKSSKKKSAEDSELEKQAILEIKREAARGRERSKTMGTLGWQKPKVSSINKRFLINTLNSARISESIKNKESRKKEKSSFVPKSLKRTSLHSRNKKRNFNYKKDTIKEKQNELNLYDKPVKNKTNKS